MTMWLKLLAMAILIVFASGRQGTKKCLFGSDKRGNCVCPAGQEGKPDLCCYDPKQEQACHVIHDPVLTSFSKFKIPLFFTCASRLAHLKIRNGHTLEIFIGNDERKKGAFFPAKISLTIAKKPNVPIHIIFDFDRKTPAVFKSEHSPTVFDAVHMNDNQVLYVMSADAELTYMKKAKIYRLSIGDVKIYVRHPTKRKHSPGVCIVKKKNVRTDAKTKGDGCFVKGKRNLVQKMAYLLDHSTTNPVEFIPSRNKKSCARYSNINRKVSNVKDNSAKKKCGVIFYKDKIRDCFYKSGPGKNNVMKSYLNCYKTMVSGNRKKCNKYKKDDLIRQCASSLLNCEKWPYYGKP